MSFQVLAFGLWSAGSAQAGDSSQSLKAIFATAFVFGIIGLGVAGIGALRNWWVASKPSNLQDRAKALETTEIQVESELAVILRFMRTYVDANDTYSKSLAQAHRNMHSLAKPEQVRAMVKFLIAENEKMQRDTADLRRNLENSSSQIEKLRWNLAEAQELGLRDPLTALSNRRCFDVNLAKEIEEAHSHSTAMCLVMGDIDRFKGFNDTFGHQIGDEILKMFAKLLSSNVKGRDTVARFGGEEFAIILPETKLADAEHLTENIRSQLESKELAVNNSGELIGQITASFGIAQLGEHDDATTLVQRADARLYEAKCAGRNRVVIDRAAAA
ncbi:MAG TPA: GGDEF domain-containing protein [Hyphomicrobiaceae bacterium]|nr:GGDEF domain-containing protein [Hyphomicrobiaceae bacterium]